MRVLLALFAVFALGCSRASVMTGATTTEPSSGTLESLLAQADAVPPGQTRFDLCVPRDLTWRGHPIAMDSALALVVDRLLGKGLFPAGFEQRPTGRRYHYAATPPE